MKISKVTLLASVILFIVVTVIVGKVFYVNQGDDVIEMLRRYGFQANSLEIKDVGSMKDPAFEWRFEKRGSGILFSENKEFSVAEADDKKFFEDRMSKRFGVKGFDSSYQLYRGDVTFGNGMCRKNYCNVYILESKTNHITYGAIYGQ